MQEQNKTVLNWITDGLQNLVSGLGTAKAKRSHNKFVYGSLNQNYIELEAAYFDNWIARQIVDAPAEDMTREWRQFKCDGADEIKTIEEELGIADATQEAVAWGRLYGGAGLLMVTNQDLSKPLKVESIKQGDLRKVLVFDRWSLASQTLNTTDVLSDNFLMPEFYTLEGGSQQIHWSHIVRFNGARLPLRQRRVTHGWGDSELRKCLEDIKDTVAAKDGIAELMQEANVDVIRREGFNDELTDEESEAALMKRYQLYSQAKSLINMALLDMDEEFDRKTLNLSGVAQVIETFMTWISGAADIPLTRLFGTSAKGMNATGEGDLKNYYNSLRSKQSSQLTPAMRVLDQVLVRSALGYWPDDYNFLWNPLEQQNDLDIAHGELLRAQKHVALLDRRVVRVSQVQRALQANEEYQFEDSDIEALEKFEEPNLFDDIGANEDDDTDPAAA